MRDVVGASLSVLCMIHCFLPIVLVAAGASFGLHHVEETMHHDWLHIALLTPIVLLLAFSLPKAYNDHGNLKPTVLAILGVVLLVIAVVLGGVIETPVTIIGSAFVISAHLLNRRSLKNITSLIAA
ncbi:MAG: MerC domain-containing protein [Gammaproteobacteria bacterium]|nr:MerC domain-containing protein [Gammaproteobacteria bacterium]